MFRMHKRIAVNGNAAGDSEILVLRRMLDSLEPFIGSQAPADRQLAGASRPQVDDDALDAARRLVADRRGIAESLLRELADLEQRLALHSGVRDASAAYEAARENAATVAAAVERTREEVATACADREAARAAEREAALRETQAQEALIKHEAELVAATEEARKLEERAESLRREVLAEATPQWDHVAEMAGQLAELKALGAARDF